MSISTFSAYVKYNEQEALKSKLQRTYGHIVQFCEPTSSSTDSSERKGLIEDHTELVLIFYFNLQGSLYRHREMWAFDPRTSLGKSTMAPSFSKMPSVIMNRLVKGALLFRLSFSTPSSTSSKLLRSL
jgi:hypothetical protein